MRHTHVVYSLYRCYMNMTNPACVLLRLWHGYSFFAAIRVTWSYIRMCDTVYAGCDQNMWWPAPPYEMNSYGIPNAIGNLTCACNDDCFAACCRQICAVYHTDYIWPWLPVHPGEINSPGYLQTHRLQISLHLLSVWSMDYERWWRRVLHRHLPPHPDEAPFVCILAGYITRQAGSCYRRIRRPCEAV